jgi:hypothetical protein
LEVENDGDFNEQSSYFLKHLINSLLVWEISCFT